MFPGIPDYISAIGIRKETDDNTWEIKVILVSPYTPGYLPYRTNIANVLKKSFKLRKYNQFDMGKVFRYRDYILPAKRKHISKLIPIKTYLLKPNPDAFYNLQSTFEKQLDDPQQKIATTSVPYDHIQSLSQQQNKNIVAFIHNLVPGYTTQSVVVINNKGILQSAILRYEYIDHEDKSNSHKQFNVSTYWFKDDRKKFPCRQYEQLLFDHPVSHQPNDHHKKITHINYDHANIPKHTHKSLFLLLNDIARIYPKVEVVYTMNYQNAIINHYIDPHYAGVLVLIDIINNRLLSLTSIQGNIKEEIKKRTNMDKWSNMEELIDVYKKSGLRISAMDSEISFYRRFNSPKGIAAIFILHLVDTDYLKGLLDIYGFNRKRVYIKS